MKKILFSTLMLAITTLTASAVTTPTCTTSGVTVQGGDYSGRYLTSITMEGGAEAFTLNVNQGGEQAIRPILTN